jgi:hypothetical protein
MADCFTKFSMMIPKVNNAEWVWLREMTNALDEGCPIQELDVEKDEHFAGWTIRPDVTNIIGDPPVIEDVEADVYLFSENTFDIAALGKFLHGFLARFRPDEILGTAFSHTCSKPRVGAFSGGAILATCDYWEVKHVEDWLRHVRVRIEDFNKGE